MLVGDLESRDRVGQRRQEHVAKCLPLICLLVLRNAIARQRPSYRRSPCGQHLVP